MNEFGEPPTPEPGNVPTPPVAPPAQAPYGSTMPPPPQGAASYGANPAGPYQQNYPAYPQPGQFAMPPQQYGYPRDHPQAGLALGLGLGGLIGGFFTCGLAWILGPFAWYFGQRARRETRFSNGAYHPEGNATAGMVLGIVSTVLLVLALLFVLFMIIGAFSTGSVDSGTNALAALFTTRS